MFTRLLTFIRQVIRKLIPYKDIESVEHLETPISTEMMNALDDWYQMYLNKADWLKPDTVKSMNLPAFISSEIARQVVLEMKWSITGKSNEDGEEAMNPRAQYLKDEFAKCISVLRQKLEQGCAAGGMTIKPYPKGEHIYFDWTIDWSLYPISFDDNGNLADVIFRDTYTEGKTVYTRLERHAVEGNSVRITQRAFKSNMRDNIGTEIPLADVPQWAELVPEAVVTETDGQMFGWFKVASANSIDVDSPMGQSVYAKARNIIREADLQYSRLLWEFEGSELAIDVDPTVLRPRPINGQNGKTVMEMPKLNERLFRGVDTGKDDNYNIFSPAIRDASIMNGLNQILMRVEDQCGLSRGTLSDANTEARTATELKIVKQRSYTTVADNQTALEACLRDVIRAMDKYATMYKLAPEGDYDVSFEWDDSILTDTELQTQERLVLMDKKVMSKVEFRMWYFGETKAQAEAAIKAVDDEDAAGMQKLQDMLPAVPEGDQKVQPDDKKKEPPKDKKEDVNADE